MSDLTKRAFYLMMSVPGETDLATLAGLVPPSDDVAAAEGESLGKQWAIFFEAGVLSPVFEAAEWFADLSTVQHDVETLLNPEQLAEARRQGLDADAILAACHFQVQRTIGAFGVALVHKLLSEGVISLRQTTWGAC